jgi:hypothetical protein
MNVWAIENAADPFGGFGANGRSVDSVVAAGGHPKHTTYPTFGHNCWETAYGDGELFSWLRSTRRSRAGVPTSLDKPVSSKATSDATPARGSTGGPIQLTPVSSGQVIQRAQSSAVPSSASRDVQANGRAVVPTPY